MLYLKRGFTVSKRYFDESVYTRLDVSVLMCAYECVQGEWCYVAQLTDEQVLY